MGFKLQTEVKKGSGLFICYVCDILAKDPGPVLAGVEGNRIHPFFFPVFVGRCELNEAFYRLAF